MPTLGFLKKKRTKDSSGPIDPSSPTSAEAPALGGDITHTFTSTPSNAPSSLSRTGSERAGGDTVHASQRPQSQGLAHQQPPTSAPRHIAHDTASTRPSEQPIPNTIGTYQTDGAGQRQGEQLRNGGTMTPAQAAAQASSHNSTNTNNTSAPSSHASSHPSTTPSTSVGSSTPQQVTRVTKGKYTLTDFAIQRTLGTGSFGRVHLVQSKHNGRFYAVKVLKKAQVVKMKQVEHTNDERKMLQKVKHAFLVTLWGTFQDSKNLYMVMDFVEGGELFSLLRKSQVS
ncbi:MAG: hypothetical protein Q9209_000416 [Squamulea sp. 1 TL-2023]